MATDASSRFLLYDSFWFESLFHDRVEKTMRIVGHRQDGPITFSASAALLIEGARFNDEIHRLPTGNRTFIPKGVFRFMSHDDANRHQLDCLVEGIARAALERT